MANDIIYPKFFIGQRVICTTSQSQIYRKGEEYVIEALHECRHCGKWYVGAVPHRMSLEETQPICCGRKMRKTHYHLIWEAFFTPVQNKYLPYGALTNVLEDLIEN